MSWNKISEAAGRPSSKRILIPDLKSNGRLTKDGFEKPNN